MKLKKITLAAILLFAAHAFAQDFSGKPQSNISYLDSIKKTFIKDNIASCVDSLWLKELTSLDLYNDLESDIKTINLDQKVEYEIANGIAQGAFEGNGFEISFQHRIQPRS